MNTLAQNVFSFSFAPPDLFSGTAFLWISATGVSWMYRMFAWLVCFYSRYVQYSCDIMAINRVKEVFHGDNKPPLSYSFRNNPSFQSVPSSSLLLLSHGREGGPVPDLYLVCKSFNGSLWMLPSSLPPTLPSPRQPIQGVSHGTPTQRLTSQCSPVTCTSLTCAHSDVHQGRVLLLPLLSKEMKCRAGWPKCGFLETGFIWRKCQHVCMC